MFVVSVCCLARAFPLLCVFILSLSKFSPLSPYLLSTLDPSSHYREEDEEGEEEEEEGEEEEEEEEEEEDEEDEEEADDESHPVTESSRQGAHRYFRSSLISHFPHIVSPSHLYCKYCPPTLLYFVILVRLRL